MKKYIFARIAVKTLLITYNVIRMLIGLLQSF